MVIVTFDESLVRKSKRLLVESPSQLLDILNIKVDSLPNIKDIAVHIYGSSAIKLDLKDNTEASTRIKALAFIDDITSRGAESGYIIDTKEFTEDDLKYIDTHYNKYNIVLYNSISRV